MICNTCNGIGDINGKYCDDCCGMGTVNDIDMGPDRIEKKSFYENFKQQAMDNYLRQGAEAAFSGNPTGLNTANLSQDKLPGGIIRCLVMDIDKSDPEGRIVWAYENHKFDAILFIDQRQSDYKEFEIVELARMPEVPPTVSQLFDEMERNGTGYNETIFNHPGTSKFQEANESMSLAKMFPSFPDPLDPEAEFHKETGRDNELLPLKEARDKNNLDYHYAMDDLPWVTEEDRNVWNEKYHKTAILTGECIGKCKEAEDIGDPESDICRDGCVRAKPVPGLQFNPEPHKKITPEGLDLLSKMLGIPAEDKINGSERRGDETTHIIS